MNRENAMQNNYSPDDISRLFGDLIRSPEKDNPNVPESVKKLLELTRSYQKKYANKR